MNPCIVVLIPNFMKQLVLPIIVLSTIFAGCGDSGSDHGHHHGGDHSNSTEPTPPANPVSVVDGVTVLEMTGNDRMKYNLETFTVPAGSPVKLVFANVGKMPKNSMGHNVVFLKSDTDANAFAAASAKARDSDFIPAEMKDQILAATKMLGPGESDTIEFTAPTEAGEYVFLCSFPAHMFAGMRGVMVVE